MKISFDFDGTLSKSSVQEFAQQLIDLGHEVHIVTSRFEDPKRIVWIHEDGRNHDDLFSVAKSLQIPSENIHFTDMADKADFFLLHPEFIWHLDDAFYEIKAMVRSKCKTLPISVLSSSYVGECLKALTKKG